MLASKLDLDGDGSSEYLVEFDTGGSLHVTGFMILDGQLDQRSYEVIGFEDTDPLDEMSHLVRRDGRIYLMWQGCQDDQLLYASTLESGKHRLVCRFGYGDGVILEAHTALDPELCQAVVEQQVDFAMTPPPIPASATGRLRPRLPPTRRGGFRPAFPTCHPRRLDAGPRRALRWLHIGRNVADSRPGPNA
jgi:hypothetical protein